MNLNDIQGWLVVSWCCKRSTEYKCFATKDEAQSYQCEWCYHHHHVVEIQDYLTYRQEVIEEPDFPF